MSGDPAVLSRRLGEPVSPPQHVRDRYGYIWRVVRDGGMVTRADDVGILTMGVVAAERQVGPLLTVEVSA